MLRAGRIVLLIVALAVWSVTYHLRVFPLKTLVRSVGKPCTPLCGSSSNTVLGIRQDTINRHEQLYSLRSNLEAVLKDVCHEKITTFPACSVPIGDKHSTTQFECPQRNLADKTVNFFAVGTGRHANFLPLYAFHALLANTRSFVEMVVQDENAFIMRHSPALVWLQKHFGLDAVCVRSLNPTVTGRTTFMNTWRYLEIPRVKVNFTYIGDVDIFITESVLQPSRLRQMELFNLSYSNVRRQNEDRLTGVMLLRTEDFYTKKFIDAQATEDAKGNDEIFLYRVIAAAGLGLPPIPSTKEALSLYRPVHGLHISLNRGIGKEMCQTTWREEPVDFCRVFTSPVLQSFLCTSGVSQRLIHEYLESAFKQVDAGAVLHCERHGQCVCSVD